MIQTWNATVTKNFTQDWTMQVGYTGVKGTDLDILRAPALGANGEPIPETQAFIWESSGGRSLMNAANMQVRRRLADGLTGGVSYTFAHAMDNASSLGAGGAVVAQNDKDLEAEYARSTFERRQQISGNLYYELPWGPNRRWLKDGGHLAAIFGEWSSQFTVTVQSGVPLTARVLGSASDLLRGVNGSLRANYNGEDIVLSNPMVDEFFNTTAFSLPAPGTFGTSSRNLITGPGSRQLNGLFQRDIRFGNRSLTLQVNANNLLNTVQWASLDTNVNSPTFGEVLVRQANAHDYRVREDSVLTMRTALFLVIALSLAVPGPALLGQQPAAAQAPVFRSAVNLVLVDVVVRDRSGAVIKGLTADDFELQEDGVRQQILSFAYDEVGVNAAPIENASAIANAATSASVPVVTGADASPVPSHPLTSEEVAGHRLITLVFDTSSMAA